MYTYRCPGCGKHHTVDSDFEQAFESTCLRCGVVIPVTAELIQQSQSPARPSRPPSSREEKITKSPASRPVSVGAEGAPVSESVEDQIDLDVDLTESIEDELEDSPSTNARKKGKQKQEEKSRTKKQAKRREEPEEDFEDEELVEDVEETPARKPALPPGKSAAKAKSRRPRWQIIAPVVAVVVVLCVAGGFLIFGGKKPEPKQAAKPAPKPVAKTTKKATPPPKKEAPPPPKTLPTKRDVAISAARLSAELAANTGITNAKYAGKVLDVSGLFKQIQSKEGLHPPPRPHALFNVSGSGVWCDLQGSFTDLGSWSRSGTERPITVRGTYEKDGYLRECALLPYMPTADNNYKGKTVEVIGRVAEIMPPIGNRPFPVVRLEGDTDSVLGLRFLFRLTDADEVSKIQLGSLLTIQGKCAGWIRETNGAIEYVRFDNCQLVYTSAPTEGEPRFQPSRLFNLLSPSTQTDSVPRLEAARMLREYEGDRHPYYLPPPGQEESIETLLAIRQLAKEQATDPKAFEKKYHHRILHIVGELQPQVGDRVVYLGSGDTDLNFQVECHFDLKDFELLRQRRERAYRIRGLYTRMSDDRTLRLDNCQLDVPRILGTVVKPDFLPHKPGNSFTIDVLTFGVPLNGRLSDVVRREVHVQGRDGRTEIAVSHVARFAGKTLFGGEAQENWVQDKKGRISIPPSTSGIYLQRVSAGFIEIGIPYPGQNGQNKIEIDWAPVLKLEVKVGEKWEWNSPAGTHEYVLEKFDDYRGHPCAVVREIFTPGTDVLHPIEILHVYAKGLGEVERREWRRLDQRGGKKLLSEMRRVETSPLDRGGTRTLENKNSAPAKK